MMLRSSVLRTLAVTLLAAALGLVAAGAQAQAAKAIAVPAPVPCALQVDPLPNGPNQAPTDAFADPVLFAPTPAFSNDYHWTHSSVHLQGTAADQKWGACVFFNPDANQTAPVDMSDWRSAVVVNNPDPALTVNATLTYRDPQGNTVAVVPITIPPEGTFVKGAIELRQFGPGIGSVEVNSDYPIVGATLHHFGHMTMSNGAFAVDQDYLSPGANSMQQLQISQDFSTTLFAGPFPASNSSAEDFLNGVLPLNCVLNPNPTQTTVAVNSFIAPSTLLTTQTVTLPPFGMLLDTSIWAIGEPILLGNPAPFNVDIITVATSSGNPILGDFLMVDLFGNGAPDNLLLSRRFRMGSGMMQNNPARRLLNPEHTETGPLAVPGPLPSTPPVETMMSFANVTANDIGPVRVEIFARTGGAPIAVFNFPTLPTGAVQRITPALLAIPENFAGWARITACQRGLIGWTMREVWNQTSPPIPFGRQFHKVYGEELNGANGAEPGKGFNVVSGGQTWIREVAPLLRAAGNDSDPDWFPSYQTGVNHASSNIGQYQHRFFTLPGVLAGQQTFPGLQMANTSFTYVDPIVTLINQNSNLSGRFDRQSGNAIGMEAIGDPLAEWFIPMFLGGDVEPELEQGHH